MDNDFSYTGYHRQSLEKARNLRKNMTEQERRLWYGFLQKYPVKFYKQRPIDFYIVDFYCSSARLVIELDGSQHYTEEGLEYDLIRTEILEKYHLTVLRFSNTDINCHFEAVCAAIDDTVKKNLSGATRQLPFQGSQEDERAPLASPEGGGATAGGGEVAR